MIPFCGDIYGLESVGETVSSSLFEMKSAVSNKRFAEQKSSDKMKAKILFELDGNPILSR